MDNVKRSDDLYKLNMEMLRRREGINAPLKLAMEIQSVKNVGRLPFLTSSNALLDSLTGKDQIIEFSDFLSTEEFGEHSRNPHSVMEKHLNIN